MNSAAQYRTVLLGAIFYWALAASAQNELAGKYRTPWGSDLELNDSGAYYYSSFECYHTVLTRGTWVAHNDTLHLIMDKAWPLSDSSLFGNTESFDDRPFIIKQNRLYFTYNGTRSRSKYFKKTKPNK